METKTCRKCDALKPVTDFGRRKAAPDGMHPWCNPCKRAYEKAHRIANPEMERAKRKRYRDANREQYLAYQKQAYQMRKQMDREALEWVRGY